MRKLLMTGTILLDLCEEKEVNFPPCAPTTARMTYLPSKRFRLNKIQFDMHQFLPCSPNIMSKLILTMAYIFGIIMDCSYVPSIINIFPTLYLMNVTE